MSEISLLNAELALRELARRSYRDYLAYTTPGWIQRGGVVSENRELRAYRRHKKRQKTERLMAIESYTFIGTVWFNWGYDEHGEWKRIGTYPKRKKHSHVQQFYKKYSNRLIRRSGKAYQNGGYRKAFDYWYTIW